MDWISGLLASLLSAFFAVTPANIIDYTRTLVLPPPRPPEARILFGGDMMFDRSMRIASDEKGQDFLIECLDPLLLDADLVVANLEGPITDNPSKSAYSKVATPDNFTFTFPTTTAQLLYRHNIKMVNLGNNHILNFNVDGVEQTKRYLQEAGVEYFGAPSDENPVARIMLDGMPVSFVNWNEWGGQKSEGVVARIREESESGRLVFVYTHWGDEYVEPPSRVKDLAHAFIDAGAEMVIGSHPHVVLESEVYKDRHIYYSLGNLIFDQYWNDAVSTGLMLEVRLTDDGIVDVLEKQVKLQRDRRTCPVEAAGAAE